MPGFLINHTILNRECSPVVIIGVYANNTEQTGVNIFTFILACYVVALFVVDMN